MVGGRFEYSFSPLEISKKIGTYEVIDNGKRKDVGDLVHMSFFSDDENHSASSFDKVVLRGNLVIHTK